MFRKLIPYLCLFISTPALGKTISTPSCNSCYSVNLTDVEEYWGNATGGQKHEGSYLGFTEVSIDVHLDKILNGHYGNFHVSAENNRGNPMSNTNLGTLDFISNIENYHQTKLYEFYYENQFGPWYFKLGKFDFARDFEIDDITSSFLNASMVTSMVINNNTFNMSNYGPAAEPGIEVRYRADGWDIGFGASSDNPYRGRFNEDFSNINTDPHGTDMSWKSTMFYAEAKKHIEINGFKGMYAVGALIDTGCQANTYNNTFHKGNDIIYVTVNQEIWKHKDKSVSLFSRFAVDPRGDRTNIDFTYDGGVFYQFGDDFLGVGFSLTKPNSRLHLPKSEMRIELTYGHTFNKYIAVQPNIQYIVHPGGTNARDELVIGVRTTFSY